MIGDSARLREIFGDLAGLRERLKDLLVYLAAHPWQMGSEKSLVKPDALEALHYAAMAGEIDVTLKHPREAAEYREVLEVVRERLASMVSIIEDLTVLVRAQEGGSELLIQEVPLRPLLETAMTQLGPLMRSRHVSIDLGGLPDLVAYAEPRLLARVFDNVLTNAVQYNRDGGNVTVRGRFEERAGDQPSRVV
mgnify:CR=1 FL=1